MLVSMVIVKCALLQAKRNSFFIFCTLAFQSRFCEMRRKDKNLNQASASHFAFKNALCRQSGLGGTRERQRE